MLEFLLDAAIRRDRLRPADDAVRRAMSRHSGTASGSCSRCSSARSVISIIGLPASRWSAGTIATRGSSNNGRRLRPAWSIGRRTMLTSARPSCRTSTWSSQVVRITSTSTLGMRGGEGPDGLCHGDAGHEADGERLRSPRRLSHPPAHGLGRGEQGPGVVEQLTTGRSQLGGSLGADEQLGPELVLERADLPGQHRLGDVQPLRRPAEMQFLGDSDEVPELAEVDVHNTFRV